MEAKPFSIENYVRRRAGHVLVSYKNNLYMWGGYMEEPHEGTYNLLTQSRSHFHNAQEIWIYSSLLNIWTRNVCKGDIPLQLSGASAGVIDNFMYLFGGFNEDDPYDGSKNILWRLDLDKFVWELLNPSGTSPFPCDKSASWVYEDKFYIFGGFGPRFEQEYYCNNVRFETERHYKGWMDQLVYYDASSNSWVWPSTKGTKPSPRAAHAAEVLKNKAYIFGGRHKEHRLNDFYSLDLKTLIWSQVPHNENTPIPLGRSWHTLNAVSDHQLVLYGGFSTSCKVLNDAWIYNTLSMTWQPIPSDKFSKRLWHCGANTGLSEVVYIGGISNNILNYMLSKEHAEDMLRIRLSPPTLFELTLDYVSKNPKIFPKITWPLLTHHVKRILEIRTDPFEIHGL